MVECVTLGQKNICQALSEIDKKQFEPHPWTSTELNGQGSANIFSNGAVLEKGGVSVSTVRGKVFGDMVKMLSIEQQIDPAKFSYFATGISIVLHPNSPMVPTIHANYRYFEIEDEKGKVVTWFFGGGTDLTPYYLFDEDGVHFHQTLKDACDPCEKGLYEKLKQEADSYFYLPHRKEHRGIGGIFSLRMDGRPAEQIYQWVENCIRAFTEGYIPIVNRRKKDAYTEAQKRWQLIRRGRYVEFNLLYDVGTHFGLKSGGNAENILMSLPPYVAWEFKHQFQPGSPEGKLMEVIKNPKKWI
jgi:coproporphyrinogen III oxidase